MIFGNKDKGRYVVKLYTNLKEQKKVGRIEKSWLTNYILEST